MRTVLLGVVAFLTVGFLFNPLPAQAWHNYGHQTVALIAYRQLDEAEQTKVQDIFKKHPHYETYLSADLPANANLDEWVVMRAATWPDWVKNPKGGGLAKEKIKDSFSQSEWHYVNKPIVYLKGATEAEKKRIKENIDDPHKNRGELLKVFPKLADGFKPNNANLTTLVWGDEDNMPDINADEAKAIGLCWILHLIGDSHQPLHSAAFYSKYSKDGEHGGNNFYVLWENRATNLHSVWDDAAGWGDLKGPTDSHYTVVNRLARDLTKNIKPAQQELDVMKFEDWVDEGFELAKTKVYFTNGKRLPGFLISGNQDKPNASDLDPLPEGYGQLVRSITEKRVALAGYRLSKWLKEKL